ncbi:MAG: DUF434 domain-containing protein [Oscillospiraceae bacterium]|nr:DUF434 domain-containing protein [Oscillospiraceae bacterium]
MSKEVRRGFVPTDQRDFNPVNLEKLKKASEEVYFLISRGYPVKSVTTFIGNHYLLSERQRLALARVISPEASIQNRKAKELSDSDLKGETLYIDGFNTIITLEIAFSDSLLFDCMDGTVRDLAGLRGTYRLVDKTDLAIQAIADTLTELKIKKAVFYLDAPVSNSGRLKERIAKLMSDISFELEISIENAVDYLLKQKNPVVTADAIILDECKNWYNLTKKVIASHIGAYPYTYIYHK